jgi:hypothetical protein
MRLEKKPSFTQRLPCFQSLLQRGDALRAGLVPVGLLLRDEAGVGVSIVPLLVERKNEPGCRSATEVRRFPLESVLSIGGRLPPSSNERDESGL